MRKGFLAGMLFLLAAAPALGETVDRVAAVVNDEVVTTYQLDRELARSLPPGTGPEEIPAERLDALRREILDNLIGEALIRQRAEKAGIKVGPEEVEAAIQDVLQQNRPTLDQLKEALQAQGMGFAEYQDTLRLQILRFKLVGREVQGRVDVTTEEIRDYFREHIDQYREEPFVRLNRLTFPLPEKASAEQAEAVRSKALEALERIRQGEDFFAVLLGYSADKTAEGGDMGTFRPDELTGAFARAVEGLGEGEVSDVVATPLGYHVLQVSELNPGRVRQFDAVKGEIEQVIRERKTREQLKEWSENLRREAYVDIRL